MQDVNESDGAVGGAEHDQVAVGQIAIAGPGENKNGQADDDGEEFGHRVEQQVVHRLGPGQDRHDSQQHTRDSDIRLSH
jgi:hypothetical protein